MVTYFLTLYHGSTTFRLRHFVYGHFVYDTSSTDILSTDISSTTVYQRVGQLYIQLLFQQIIIFIIFNFYLHYDSILSIPFPLTHNIVSKHCGLTIKLVLSIKYAYLRRIPCINPVSIDVVFFSSLQLLYSGSNTDYKSSEPLKTIVMLCYVISARYFVYDDRRRNICRRNVCRRNVCRRSFLDEMSVDELS